MRSIVRQILTALLLSIAAFAIDITDFGAVPNDGLDDTAAIKAALAQAADDGGGIVKIPKGTFIISRGKSGACILEVPSNTIVEGEGTASILKFDEAVNKTNFWRMIGSYRAVENVVIRDLALDGSNTATKYEPGRTFEQNHGVWFFAKEGQSKNITIDNVYAHHFSGDCIALGRGSVAAVIRNCSFHDGLRQGIQVGAHDGGSNIQVLNNRELPNVLIEGSPRGLHLEHNTGVTKVLVSGNVVNGPILAGDGIDGLTITGNHAMRIEGNINRNVLVTNNQLHSDHGSPAISLGLSSNVKVSNNMIVITNPETFAAIYAWDSAEEKKEGVMVTDNFIRCSGVAVAIAGMKGGLVSGNYAPDSESHYRNHYGRSEDIVVRNPLEE
ncbi:MAG: polygalacturonase [Verrucomicrobiales bacterium]|jgi:polygalacturonase